MICIYEYYVYIYKYIFTYYNMYTCIHVYYVYIYMHIVLLNLYNIISYIYIYDLYTIWQYTHTIDLLPFLALAFLHFKHSHVGRWRLLSLFAFTSLALPLLLLPGKSGSFRHESLGPYAHQRTSSHTIAHHQASSSYSIIHRQTSSHALQWSDGLPTRGPSFHLYWAELYKSREWDLGIRVQNVAK